MGVNSTPWKFVEPSATVSAGGAPASAPAGGSTRAARTRMRVSPLRYAYWNPTATRNSGSWVAASPCRRIADGGSVPSHAILLFCGGEELKMRNAFPLGVAYSNVSPGRFAGFGSAATSNLSAFSNPLSRKRWTAGAGPDTTAASSASSAIWRYVSY